MKKPMIYGATGYTGRMAAGHAKTAGASVALAGRSQVQLVVEAFVQTTNAFDIEGALELFTSDAVIDDFSVGDAFVGRDGVRAYLQRFFVGYHTRSKLLSIEEVDNFNALARLDFTGDFGHEIGVLKIAIDAQALIARIDADLE